MMQPESTNNPYPTFPPTDTAGYIKETQILGQSQLDRKCFHFCFFLRFISSFSGKSSRGGIPDWLLDWCTLCGTFSTSDQVTGVSRETRGTDREIFYFMPY